MPWETCDPTVNLCCSDSDEPVSCAEASCGGTRCCHEVGACRDDCDCCGLATCTQGDDGKSFCDNGDGED